MNLFWTIENWRKAHSAQKIESLKKDGWFGERYAPEPNGDYT